MDADFWRQRWDNNEIAFHQGKPNPLLVTHFEELALMQGSRLFLPLCGKTRDLAWLLSQGFRVAGAELSNRAIEQLFAELGAEPDIVECGTLSRYRAPNIDIFVGDLFDVSQTLLGPIDAVYDRAALVALPGAMRKRYAMHLLEITDAAKQLVITFEYDQSLMNGPPFSVDGDEVHRHYSGAYDVTLLESTPVPGGLKKRCPATENAWLLKK